MPGTPHYYAGDTSSQTATSLTNPDRPGTRSRLLEIGRCLGEDLDRLSLLESIETDGNGPQRFIFCSMTSSSCRHCPASGASLHAARRVQGLAASARDARP